MSHVFRLEHVSKTFSRSGQTFHALDDVTLDIPAGSFYGIVGTSGAGKSTLLRLLNRLDTPSAGEIHFHDTPLSTLQGAALRDYLSKVATVFQHFNLFHGKTVLENIELPLAVRGVPRQTRRRKAEELVQLVGLQGKEHAYPSQLSGGQKQRVGIARALVADAEVLLCDEATSALDSDTTTLILDLLLDLRQRFNLTIVLITHSWEVVRYAADSVTLIQHGRIVETGAVRELLHDADSWLGRQLLPAPDLGHAPPHGWLRYELILADVRRQSTFFSDVARRLGVTAAVVSGGVERLGGADAARFKVDFDLRGHAPSIREALSALLRQQSIVLGKVA
ncbi:methionine ABC transporter ATP-binding protein [Caballeronia sp. LZ034LL]|uniref:methionine ABC transporter ATP-binding protein n=1 Tax=Caballeronia sp. LZ034LL TaxID=3038567 RepID=UPI0028613504|nr:methionine ABC transporter ATP-binding protein [Caballeronia sp. LZ034LL]MDR5836076.1 methionine ABC transporter ATP-binding protein [Caballeronia sp. LZ034LL]